MLNTNDQVDEAMAIPGMEATSCVSERNVVLRREKMTTSGKKYGKTMGKRHEKLKVSKKIKNQHLR
jgi:hypothetical protein